MTQWYPPGCAPALGEMFDNLSIYEFWAKIYTSYPRVAKKCITKLLSFTSTYLCDSGFSTLMQMKNKTRNRLDVENGLRYALFSTHSRIDKLVYCVQQLVSQ